jgi:hypothetical protein
MPSDPGAGVRLLVRNPDTSPIHPLTDRRSGALAGGRHERRRRRGHDCGSAVGELTTRSDDFCPRHHDVRHHGTGTERFDHAVVGELTLADEAVEMTAEPDLTLTMCTAEPGSASEDRIRLLGSWQANVPVGAGPGRPTASTSRAPAVRKRVGDGSMIAPLDHFTTEAAGR